MKTTVAVLHYQRHLLPTGKLALPLFPGTPLETYTFALKHGLHLGLHMEALPCHLGSIGTVVSVEDFYSANKDCIMHVQLVGEDRYIVEKSRITPTGIHLAEVRILPSWPEQCLDDEAQLLAEKLQSMFERYPELGYLHHYPNFDSLTWLCQRWLELLPLPISEKQSLMSANSCNNTAQYLLSLMKELH